MRPDPSQVDATSPRRNPKRHDVGILVVHGIGQQKKGDEVARASAAIYKFADGPAGRALLGCDTSAVHEKIPCVRIQATDLQGSPSHCELEVSEGKHLQDRSRWIVAESWWAEAYTSPSVRQTLKWLCFLAPVLVTSRAAESLIYSWRYWWHAPLSYWRVLWAALWLFFSFPVTVVLIVVVSLLVLVRVLIPFSWLNDALGRAQVIITGFIGDSMLFVADPVRQAAMLSVVERDLEWLSQRCKKIVIVAHSQGAAITVEALKHRPFAVEHLITLGAGVGQLTWIQRLASWRRVGLFVQCTLASFITFGLPFMAIAIYRDQLSEASFIWVLGLPMIMLYSMPTVFRAIFSEVRPAYSLAVASENKALPGTKRWQDLWGTADPVSGGPSTWMLYPESESRAVWNHGNVLRDHSSYLTNSLEVMSAIFRAAHDASRKARGYTTSVTPDTEEILKLHGALRHKRGHSLVQGRVLLLVVACTCLVYEWQTFLAWGQSLATSARNLGSRIPWLTQGITVASSNELLMALLSWLLTLAIVYIALLMLWKIWGIVENGKFFEGDLQTPPNPSVTSEVLFRAFEAFLLGLAIIAVMREGFAGVSDGLDSASFSAFLAALIIVPLAVAYVQSGHLRHSRKRIARYAVAATLVFLLGWFAYGVAQGYPSASERGWIFETLIRALSYLVCVVVVVLMSIVLRKVGHLRAHTPATSDAPGWLAWQYGVAILVTTQILIGTDFISISPTSNGMTMLLYVSPSFIAMAIALHAAVEYDYGPKVFRWLNWTSFSVTVIVTLVAFSLLFSEVRSR